MSIIIQKPGILTTFQDTGRTGARQYGINPNGAMDRTAARLLNILLGNNENETVLEMNFPTAEIKFVENAFFAVGGADFGARLDEKSIENWRVYHAEQNSVLRFPEKKFGNLVYLAVNGGFAVEKWLGSGSTNLMAKIGGFQGRKLEKGDTINFQTKSRAQFLPGGAAQSSFKIAASLLPFYSRFPTVRVVAGAEFELLTAHGEQVFRHYDFVVSPDSNRMGFRLKGAPIYLLNQKEMVSAAVNFGTIQLLPDGQMIILMADHQTSGGYPRLGNVIETDLPLVAQLGANDKIAFYLIAPDEAENVLHQHEKDLKLLKIGVKYAMQSS